MSRLLSYSLLVLLLTSCSPNNEEATHWGELDYVQALCGSYSCPSSEDLDEGTKKGHHNENHHHHGKK